MSGFYYLLFFFKIDSPPIEFRFEKSLLNAFEKDCGATALFTIRNLDFYEI